MQDLIKGKNPREKIGSSIDVVEIRGNVDNVSPSHDLSLVSELLKESLKSFVIESKVVIERFGGHFEQSLSLSRGIVNDLGMMHHTWRESKRYVLLLVSHCRYRTLFLKGCFYISAF